MFLNKRILIYGLGKSGLSAFKFLKNKNEMFLFDDYQINNKSLSIKRNLIKFRNIFNIKFDLIVISPGIDINKCKLSRFLKKIGIKFILIWMYFTHFIKMIASLSLVRMENLQHVNLYMRFCLNKSLMLN